MVFGSLVLASGDALLLPVTDAAHQEAFERRREEYHQVLVEEFKENFEVTGSEDYKIESGIVFGYWRVNSNCRSG